VFALFADDGAAWPISRKGQRYASLVARLRELMPKLEAWMARWKLVFSVEKSPIVLFSNKLSSPSPPSPPLLLADRRMEFVDHFKYLGLTFQCNGRWNMQFDVVATKCKLTANLIARINSRNHPPSPTITASLVKYVLIPQMSYAFAFWRPNKSQLRILNQIIATPLRRALGLHRSASAVRVLWEFGIPSASVIRLRCILQTVSRAFRSARCGNYLPSLLVQDVSSDEKGGDKPAFCRSFRCELEEVKRLLPANSKFPLDKKVIKAVVASAMRTEWSSLSSVKAKAIKPLGDCARYISVDPKPIVCIRARLRLSVALTPQRRHVYRLADSPRCGCGWPVGDTNHVVMLCPKFASARSVCSNLLLSCAVPVKLTLDLVLGNPPLVDDQWWSGQRALLRDLHDQCLNITGDFLLFIDRSIHL
jgi:hypothetical protein